MNENRSIRTVVAPRVLGVTKGSLSGTLDFLHAVRKAVVEGHSVVVDLRECTSLSRAACLMLCAEVELCRHMVPGSVNGFDPSAAGPRKILEELGFHRQLEHPHLKDLPCGPSSLVIHSGVKVGEGTASDLAQIADLAKGRLPAAVTEAVFASLQEAMLNIQDHAYEGAASEARIPGKWWFAGALLNDGLSFLAYDHGLGIAHKAKEKMSPALEEYWMRRGVELGVQPQDVLVLEAALGAARDGISLGGRGKGFPFMINLIERQDIRGRLYVVSGRAAARFSRQSESRAELDMEALSQPLRGTLFAWQVSFPREA